MIRISNRNEHSSRHSEKGTALVAALWMSLILALLSISMISLAQKNTLKTKIDNKLEEAWILAEGGIAIASFHISDPTEPWRPRREPYGALLDDQEVMIYVGSPQAKIDLNAGTPALLTSLFYTLGYEDTFSVSMGSRIADWRDGDEFVSLNGAENKEYLLAGEEVGPKNGPFDSVHELNGVLGVDKDVFDCVSPFLTTFSPNGRVDPYFAGDIIRRVVGVKDIVLDAAQNLRRTSVVGQVYEITAQVSISEYAAASVTSVIRFTGNPSDPVWRHSTERSIVRTQKLEQDSDIHSIVPNSCPLNQRISE